MKSLVFNIYIYVARTVQKSEVIIFENSCRPSLSSVRNFYERRVIDARYNKIENKIEFIHV